MKESEVSSTVENDILTIKVHGVFNFSLYTQFSEAYQNKEYKSVHVDLSTVSMMDSSALGMLLLLRVSLPKNVSEPVKLINANKTILTVLRIANFHKIFDVGGE